MGGLVRRVPAAAGSCFSCICACGPESQAHPGEPHEPPPIPQRVSRYWRIDALTEPDEIPVGTTIRKEAFHGYSDYGMAVPFESATTVFSVFDGRDEHPNANVSR
jgi:hypothetical protein